MKNTVRIGIDVGGTFTDVVVISQATNEVISQLKIPTTHHAPEGVALGIMRGIEQALQTLSLNPQDVVFIAHSTTQATNALLEGDVAKVGIIGIGDGFEGWKAKLDTHIPAMELAPNRFLQANYAYFKPTDLNSIKLATTLADWKATGVEVIVASEAFGVDAPEHEKLVCQTAEAFGLLATSGHQVSGLYGLRTRTRTAVLNGGILPKMIHTASMTNNCVKQAGITAPLMIMRSDGGVMGVEEVYKRPIMTMLSGPAAGIAGALMHERVSDGIFIEVGGTSADISVIRDGQPQIKSARVGGYRTYLNTLDVRTLAIAGGSMIRAANHKLVDVGSRSAHIAGLAYASFQSPAAIVSPKLVFIQPTPDDTNDYVAIQTADGKQFALTPTCAANLLGVVPTTAFAYTDPTAAHLAFQPLADFLGLSVEETARQVLTVSCQKVAKQIDALIKEYQLDRHTIELVGGGGGAASLVPFTGQLMQLPARLANKAEVISTIGVALAMVRDTVERTIIDPTPEAILAVRNEAAEAVHRIGAIKESIEVQVEVDTRRNLVRATAFGTTELKKSDSTLGAATADDRVARVAHALQVEQHAVNLVGQTPSLYVYTVQKQRKLLFGLWKPTQLAVRITDASGVIKFQRNHVQITPTSVATALSSLEQVVNHLTDYGDAGRSFPDFHLVVGSRIIQLIGLATVQQVLALANAELQTLQHETNAFIIATLSV